MITLIARLVGCVSTWFDALPLYDQVLTLIAAIVAFAYLIVYGPLTK